MTNLTLPEFADKINELMPVLVKEFTRRQSDVFSKGKITIPQFLILSILYKQGKSKMSALAEFMGVTTAAMTGIVDRLVRDGYATRERDSKDRRIVRIKLTPKASSLVKRIFEQRRQMIIRIFGHVSQEERQTYLKILTKIKEAISPKDKGI